MSAPLIPLVAALGLMALAVAAFCVLMVATVTIGLASQRLAARLTKGALYCLAFGTFPGFLYILPAAIVISILVMTIQGQG